MAYTRYSMLSRVKTDL